MKTILTRIALATLIIGFVGMMAFEKAQAFSYAPAHHFPPANLDLTQFETIQISTIKP